MKVEDLKRLTRAEKMMIRLMCGADLKNEGIEKLYEKLNAVAVQGIVRTERLKWFGHVERRDSDEWISKCRYISFDDVGGKGRGRGRKTWQECVRQDLGLLGLKKGMGSR